MNYSQNQSSYMRGQARSPQPAPSNGNRKYILFTWSRCKQCQDLKKNLNRYIQAGKISEYDLDTLSNNPNLMRLFNQTSPMRNVPAMAIINNGSLERTLVGVGQIMTLF